MSEKAEVARVLAPAKLTVSLRVLARRADGFHQLDAEMVSLDLVDELFIEPGVDGLDIELDALNEAPPSDSTNLICRAFKVLGRQAGVRLVKRIPMGGGLGGGSADAAAVLRWAGCHDLALAAHVGADVPFCMVGGRARVGGIGEIVTSVDFESQAFVLLIPPLSVDTAAAYRAWDQLPAQLRHDPGDQPNDLSEAALVVQPALRGWRERFGELTGQIPRLAGSGATWFVEGTAEGLGLDLQQPVVLGGQLGRLIAVRAVPAGYSGL